MLHSSDYVSNLPLTVPKAHTVQVAEASTSSSKSPSCSSFKSTKNPPLSAFMNLPGPLNSYNTAFDTVQSILPTALIKVKSAYGKLLEARALLDSGSEVSFISHSLIKKVYIPRTYNKQVVNGLANMKIDLTKGTCTLQIAINHKSTINIIASKTRVTPLKQISLPCLELSGALFLCNLIKSFMVTLNQFKFNVYARTDFTIILAWPSEFPRSWKTFVANRCTEIEIIPRSQWNHISGSIYPSDCASRGISSHLVAWSCIFK